MGKQKHFQIVQYGGITYVSLFHIDLPDQIVLFYLLMVVVIIMGNEMYIYLFDKNKNKLYSLPKPQDNFVALTSMFAVSSGSIGVDLQDIPNEPLRFIV